MSEEIQNKIASLEAHVEQLQKRNLELEQFLNRMLAEVLKASSGAK